MLEKEGANYLIYGEEQNLNIFGSFLESFHSFKEIDPDNTVHLDVDSFLEEKCNINTIFQL